MSEWAEWVEILWGFTIFYFKQMLKVSAFYLEKQKSFIPKTKFFKPLSISKQKNFVYWLNFPEGFGQFIQKLQVKGWVTTEKFVALNGNLDKCFFRCIRRWLKTENQTNSYFWFLLHPLMTKHQMTNIYFLFWFLLLSDWQGSAKRKLAKITDWQYSTLPNKSTYLNKRTYLKVCQLLIIVPTQNNVLTKSQIQKRNNHNYLQIQ